MNKTSKAVEVWIKALEKTEVGQLTEEGIHILLSILYKYRRQEDDLQWIVELSEGMDINDDKIRKMAETAKDSLSFDYTDDEIHLE